MRNDPVDRARRFRLACNLLSILLLLIALRQLLEPALTAINPVLGTAEFSCSPCRIEQDPVRLLDAPLRKWGWQTPGVDARIIERVQTAKVHWLLTASALSVALPLFLLFLSLAIAVRRFAQRGFASNAANWLRLAGWSALAWGLMGPVSRSFQALALDAVFTGADRFRLPIDFFHVITGVVIAGIILAAIWALEEAVEIQRDLADYV
jgi:hypothetical protein